MAVVPVSQGASVEARPQPFVPQNTQFDPNAFGAGVGQATQGLGQMVGKDAEEGAKIATNMAIQNDQNAHKVADTNAEKQATDIGYTSLPGGPDGNHGYYSLKGQDAVTYRPAYQKALDDMHQQIRDSMADSPRAQNWFNQTSTVRAGAAYRQSGVYAMDQGLVADNNASAARLGAYKDSLTVNYNDPTALANYQQVTRGEVADTGRRMGWGTDQIAEATTKALSGGYRDAILARVTSGDVAGAGAMFHELAPGMDASTRVSLAQHLQPLMTGAAADQLVKGLLGGATAPGTAPASDPGLPRGIRNNNPGNLNFANQDGAMLENHDSPRFAAFPTMDQGVQALGHQIQLDNSRGFDTISKLVSKYAPPSENNTQGYIAAVAQSTGFAPDAPLDTSNPATMKALQKAIISHENGNQYGVLADGQSAPAGNATDANPAIHPDFAGVQQKVLDATAGDTKLQAAALNRLHTAASQYGLSTQADRDKIEKGWNDTVASATAGNDTTSIDEALIRHVFRPGVADSMIGQFHEAVVAGQVTGAIKLATPAQTNMILGSLTADVKDEDPAHFVQRNRLLSATTTAIAQKQKALSSDPATYAMQDPNVAAAYQAVDPQKPETLQAAVEASFSTQRSLGVSSPSVLGTADAAAMVKKIETPTQGDMGAQLNQIEKQYGSHYGDVITDLTKAGLSPRYQMLAHANLPEQATVRSDAQAAFQEYDALKDKGAWAKGVPATEEKLLKPAVDLAVANYRKTLQGSSDPHDTIGTVIVPSITQTAQYYMTRGMGAEAAVTAAAGLINKSYAFDDELRVPTAPGMPTVSQVRSSANGLTNGLSDADLESADGYNRRTAGMNRSPATAPPTTAAEARSGTWFTNGDDKGATLFKGTTQGGFMPVRKADGSYLSIPFNKLPSPGPAIPAPGQAAVMNVGLN